jgi:hypothetical protein
MGVWVGVMGVNVVFSGWKMNLVFTKQNFKLSKKIDGHFIFLIDLFSTNILTSITNPHPYKLRDAPYVVNVLDLYMNPGSMIQLIRSNVDIRRYPWS